MMGKLLKTVRAVFGILLCSVLIVCFAVAWRLNSGPISLGFLKPQLVAALTPKNKSYELEIEEPIFRWQGWNSNIFDVTLKNVKISSEEQRISLQSPSILIGLNKSALFDATLVPERITINDAKFFVKSSISDIAPQEYDGTLDVEYLKTIIEANTDISSLSSIQSITVTNSNILINDQASNSLLEIIIQKGEISRTAPGIRARVTSKIVSSARNSSFSLSLDYPNMQNEIQGTGEFTSIPFSIVKKFAPFLHDKIKSKTGLTGEASFTLNPFNQSVKVSTSINAKNGTLNYNELFSAPIKFKILNSVIGYDNTKSSPLNGTLKIKNDKLNFLATLENNISTNKNISNIQLSSKSLSINDLNNFWPKHLAPETYKWVVANITHGDISELALDITATSNPKTPLKLDTLRSSGRFNFRNLQTHFLKPSPPIKKMQGNAHFSDNSLDIRIKKGVIDDISVDGSLIEVSQNNTGKYQIDVNLMANGPVQSIRKLLENESLGINENISSIPDGITGDTDLWANFSVPLGEFSPNKEIPFSASAKIQHARIPKAILGKDFEKGELRIDVDGDRLRVLGISDFNGSPFTFEQETLFNNNSEVNGTKKFSLNITSTDLKKLNLPIPLELDGMISLKAKIIDLAEGNSKVNATIDLMNSELLISQLNWKKPLGSVGRLTVDVDIQNNKVIRLNNINLITSDLNINAQAKITGISKGTSKITAVIDLINSDLSIPHLNWRKLSGSAGRLRVAADIQNSKLIKLRTINLVAADLNLDAKADFHEQTGRVKNIIINNLSVGDSEMGGTILLNDNGHYHAKLKGKKINLNRFISGNNQSPDAEKIKFSVAANFDQVFLWDLPPIKNVNLKIEKNTISIPKIKLVGVVDECPIHINSVGKDRVRQFLFKSKKAGCVLKGLDITESVIGGEITIIGEILSGGDQEKTFSEISITDFGLKDTPLFTQILNAASLSGLINTLRGKGIQFEQLNAKTIFTKDKIEIIDSLAKGNSLGVLASGTIMRHNKEAEINGMIVPAYRLNEWINKIPVLGEIITGGQKEGFFAVEYSITQSLEAPEISVDEINSLTPGILRTFVKATRESLQ